ncbi:oxysterol-binding protein-related protein 8-like isoform X3 [Ptychodera flava]|uniref:oxysterol-binding protein-related protein 8-like isoform X3 n=2 Tax=Ptychodera flava TaxID=63121 RepID=UPI00396A86BE
MASTVNGKARVKCVANNTKTRSRSDSSSRGSTLINVDAPSSPGTRARMLHMKKELSEGLSDSSPNYSPVPGQGLEDDEYFHRLDPNRESSQFKAHRSKSEGKLHSLDYKSVKLAKRESLKAQKKNYRREKKRATKELLSSLKDPSVVVLSGWLKVRGTLKGWTKLWCVLKPGLLLIYKSSKHGQWVGTVLLNSCDLIERPSRKDGFCFKVFHPLDQSIWATRGPKGESMGSITIPLPSNYLIFRAPSEADGKCWMDALELSLRCSSLLMRSMKEHDAGTAADTSSGDLTQQLQSFLNSAKGMNESEIENKHFRDQGLDEPEHDDDDKENEVEKEKESDSEGSEEDDDIEEMPEVPQTETNYVPENKEDLGQEFNQVDTIADENKSIVWMLIKQVRPGMDLSKVVLPTFILEPRSWLDKLSDYCYHADFLSRAVKERDPFSRMKQILRWYLSGFYKKPKGAKKPYNPILGETFRCMWPIPSTGSKTFYIAEQVSHHPPISAFYVSNRADGFCISGSILAKSKFYGNSIAAILDGTAKLSLITRGEDYLVTMPYAYCKGILYGTLTMEYGGKVSIECEKTGYKTDLEFKLKPLLGSSDSVNHIVGKVKLGKETIATIDGRWDDEVYIKDKRTGESELFWHVTDEVMKSRLKRHKPQWDEMGEFESQKLWIHVTEAINKGDQVDATKEKTILEEAQRQATRERKAKRQEWLPRLFEQDVITGEWLYKHADARPWDVRNDINQYESNGIIRTKTKHRTPMVRTTSIISLAPNDIIGRRDSKLRQSTRRAGHVSHTRTSLSLRPINGAVSGESECSTPDLEHHSGSSDGDDHSSNKSSSVNRRTSSDILQAIRPIQESQQHTSDQLKTISHQLLTVARYQEENQAMFGLRSKDWFLLCVVLVTQVLLNYFMK